MAKLTDVCDIQYGYAFDSGCFTDDDSYPQLVRIRDVKRGFSETYYSGEYPEDYVLNAGDLLVGMDGEFNIARWKVEGALLNQRVCKIVARPDTDEEYLRFVLGKALKAIEDRTSFATVKHLSAKELNKLELDLPKYEEQVHRSTVLAKLEAIIEQRQYELDKLDELIKARFVELFDINNCEKVPLGECTDFVDYRGHTPKLSDEGTIRMINAKSVGKGFFKYVDEYVTEETYDNWMHRGFGYPGDILFVTEGHTFGNVCLIPEDLTKFALGQRVITIKGHKEIQNAFLCSYMQTDMFWKDINTYRTGGTAQGIRSKDLVKVCVPIPPIDHQTEFMSLVKQVDKSKVVA